MSLAPVLPPVARATAKHLLDLLFPPRPLNEDRRDPEGVQSIGMTAGAWGRIHFIEAPFCHGCGAPFEYDLGPGARCAACQGRTPAFDHARAACLYDEHSRDLILKLKHADRTDLSGLFARWLSRAVADLAPDIDAVTPVPLHRWRLLGRRYNQAAEIARPLARMTGLTYFPDALIRNRATASQSGRSGSSRRRNVAGVFAVPPGWRSRVEGKNHPPGGRRADHRRHRRGLRAGFEGSRRGAGRCGGDRAGEGIDHPSYMTEVRRSLPPQPGSRSWPPSPSTPVRSAAFAPTR